MLKKHQTESNVTRKPTDTSCKSYHTSHGFTLIELIMVVVILGILAAFALPKFANISTDSRLASLDALRAAVAQASKTAHLTCQVTEGCLKAPAGAGVFVPAYNDELSFVFGYLNSGAHNSDNDPNIEDIIDVSGFDVVEVHGASTRWDLQGTTNCYVQYEHPHVLGNTPNITIDNSGC